MDFRHKSPRQNVPIMRIKSEAEIHHFAFICICTSKLVVLGCDTNI